MPHNTACIASANLLFLFLDGLLKDIKLKNKYTRDNTNTVSTMNTSKKIQKEQYETQTVLQYN